jgi:glyoxylate reductase
MAGKTLGVVGMGRIGSMVARRAHGFGMKVLYFNRKKLDEAAEKESGVEYREKLEDLLSESDYVSLHVPLSAETRHLINGKTLASFKKSAYLVNTARGPVVSEAEVVVALYYLLGE